MHFCDGLIDSVLVFLSLEAVVLNVVDELQKEHSHESVMELVDK